MSKPDVQSKLEREDFAKLALERKNANLLQLQGLEKQIAEMQT